MGKPCRQGQLTDSSRSRSRHGLDQQDLLATQPAAPHRRGLLRGPAGKTCITQQAAAAVLGRSVSSCRAMPSPMHAAAVLLD